MATPRFLSLKGQVVRRVLIAALGTTAAVLAASNDAYALPQPPHQFVGMAYVDGVPA